MPARKSSTSTGNSGRTHDLADLLDARRRQQIAGLDADLVTVDEERREERQPRDVIEVVR